jgi:hypothetical protein
VHHKQGKKWKNEKLKNEENIVQHRKIGASIEK